MNAKKAKALRRIARDIEEDDTVEHFFQPRDKTVYDKSGDPHTMRSLQLRLKPTCQKALYKRAKALYLSGSATQTPEST